MSPDPDLAEDAGRELLVARVLRDLAGLADEVNAVTKLTKVAARGARDVLGAGSACLAVRTAGFPLKCRSVPAHTDRTWTRAKVDALLADPPREPRTRLFAPLERHGRPWAVLAVERDVPFSRPERRVLARIARALETAVARFDRARFQEIRARIDRKIIERLSPKDLFYQILDGLETLTGYDHSAALVLPRRGSSTDAFEIVAERALWREDRKSRRIGRRFTASPECVAAWRTGDVLGYDRGEHGWAGWTGAEPGAVVELLDYNAEAGPQRESAMICAPLSAQGRLLGVLKIAARHPGALGAYEANLVREFLPHTQAAINNLQAMEAIRANLDHARSFQRSLMPPRETPYPGGCVRYECILCEELGGDFFDVTVSAAGDLTALLADVSGHGAQAAMVTAVVKSAFRDAAATQTAPHEILGRIRGSLRYFERDLFVTAVCLRIRADAGVVEYANGGHPAPLLRRRGETRWVTLEGSELLLSAAFDAQAWNLHRAELRPGDLLVLYTDGVAETRGSAGFFEEHRLKETLERKSAAGAGDLVASVLHTLRRFRGRHPQEDDVTLVAFGPEDAA